MFPLEFDEDDPLAGLLSDEEDDLASKPKPKKTSTPKNTRSSGITSQGVLRVFHYFTMYSEFEMVQYTVQHLPSKKKSYSSVVSDTGGLEEKIQVFPRGVEPMTYWLLFTCPDDLPLSYTRLVGPKVTKLGSCDIAHKHILTFESLSSVQDV